MSEVEIWEEDGLWVIRSTEFECYAEADTFLEAIVNFGETVEDLSDMYADLTDDLSLHEAHTSILITSRLLESYKREINEADAIERNIRRISIHFGKRRRAHRQSGTHWAPVQTQPASSQPSPV